MFNLRFELDPRSTHLKIVNNSEGFSEGVDGLLVLGLAHGVVGSLLGSEGSSVLDGLFQEGDVVDGGGELGFGSGQEFLSVSNGGLALSLSFGVGISLVSGVSDFSLTDDQVFVVLGVGLSLLSLFLGNQLIHEVNDVINDTFRCKVNL